MVERALSNRDVKDMDIEAGKDKWDGKERRKAINSTVDPYHERRKDGQRNIQA